jgi:hypothetical protein
MDRTKRYSTSAAIIILMISFFAVNSWGQAQVAIEKSFADHKDNTAREKLFVHINKSFYTTGEIVWFKLYCTDAKDNKPLGLSKVAYVELIDEHRTAVVQTMIALNDGMGGGSFYLPFTLASGIYKLKAYTAWMRNFDASYFYENTITVLNPFRPGASVKSPPEVISVRLMPEGGRLVQGLQSKVAFKITDGEGKGLDEKGAIVDTHGDTVARFSTLKFGMGSFMLRPMPGERYKAIIKPNNLPFSWDLPQVSLSGYVLQVIDNGEAWHVNVKNSDSTVSHTAYLILHNNYSSEQVKELHLANGVAQLSINKSQAAEGISYITLFDDAGAPVCERMVFRRPTGKLLINASPGHNEYNKRSKVDVSIVAFDEHKDIAPANMSVSVFRADDLQNKDPEHISGYLWLKASLKGRIESPDYYLNDTGAEVNTALDNLLLTQGWTQFNWSKTDDAAKMRFLPEYTGPIVTARVINIADNTPAPEKMVYLTINGTPQQLYVAKSDSAGKVIFNTQNFYGPHEVVVQTNGQVDSTCRVDIQSPYAEPGTGMHVGSFRMDSDLKTAIDESSLNIQVQNIFAASQTKQFYPAATDSTWFFGKPTRTYKLDDYTRFTTMEEVLREYVGYIAVAKHQGKFGIKIFNGDLLLGNPLVLLDGIPVFDADKVFKWDPLKIKQLDVVHSNYVYGPTLFNGIMSFTTYKGEGASIEIDPHAVVVDYEGLQQQRKFYSPAYDTEAHVNSTLPDFRTALYWNPNIITDASGKSSFTFYTSDKPGQYIGILEGITPTGKTGSGYFSFSVKK